jgi:hypothetical protein
MQRRRAYRTFERGRKLNAEKAFMKEAAGAVQPGSAVAGARTVRARRFFLVAAVAALHLIVYYIVTRLTPLRPPDAFVEPRLWIDDRIPHAPSTWPLYWLPYILVPTAMAAAMLRLTASSFRRLIVVWSAMIVVAGIVQVAFPAVAPWPPDPAPAQRAFHESPLILPYATLPSMHVAHTALAAAVFGTVFRNLPVTIAAAAATVLVALSTLTLKEHVVLDAVSGLALAAAAFATWRGGARARAATILEGSPHSAVP